MPSEGIPDPALDPFDDGACDDKISAFQSVTLDGVMQGPGRGDEDTRGGFKYGGWARSPMFS